ncbi:hypothetical protein ATCC90586_003989 [Pythium insidiosum]|nr:hypothetical protein ATCC90586_003989 [Pythium insidiosum]
MARIGTTSTSTRPPLELTDDDEFELRHLAADLEREAMVAYEEFTYTRECHVDPARWKLLRAKGELQVFRERDCVKHSNQSTTSHTDRSPSICYSTETSSTLTDDGLALRKTAVTAMEIGPRQSMAANSSMPCILVTGSTNGTLDDALYGITIHDTASLRTRIVYQKSGVDDAAVVATLETGNDEDPYRFMGITWFLKDYPVLNAVVRPRDLLLFTSIRQSTTSRGERIGIAFYHSITHRDLPEHSKSSVIRVQNSLSIVMRQLTDQRLEIFMINFVDPLGRVPEMFVTQDIAHALLTSADLPTTGVKKKVNYLLRHRNRFWSSRDDDEAKDSATACCCACSKRLAGFFSNNGSVCQLCRELSCTKCLVTKKIVAEATNTSTTCTIAEICVRCFMFARKFPASAMRPDFPIPRAHLPTIDVTPQEHAHRQREVDSAVLQTMEAFQHYRGQQGRGVDGRMWKPIAGREKLSVFKERRRGTASTISTDSSLNRDGVSWTGAENEPHHTHAAGSRRRASYSAPLESDRSMDSTRRLLLVGEMPGRVESLLYGLVTKNQEELALLNTYYYEDIADCALLNVMTPPTADRPLEFLGYKWLVKRAPTLGRGKRHRDAVYIESCGLTTMPVSQDVDDEDDLPEETIGYHVMQSVRLTRFPEWEYRNCTRMQHGACFLFRQAKPTTIEVFALANVEYHAGHKRMSLRPILHVEQLLAVSRLMDIAEAKRLTLMIKKRRAIREERHEGTRSKPGPLKEPAKKCALCRQRKRFYNVVNLKDCVICEDDVCAKCRVQRSVFLSDGTLGRIQRIECCKSCAISAASATSASCKEPERPDRDRVAQPEGGSRYRIAILDRFQRMMELREVAESTYQTARRNAALVQQQQEEQERKASSASFNSSIGDFR